MTSLKYYIGDIGFKTKKECENYTRNIINNLGCCVIDKNHDKYTFFINLLNNHPNVIEKKGLGIEYFYIEPNPLIKKYYQTKIKRIDGSHIDFSWVSCSKFQKNKTNEQNLVNAMRNSISFHIINFKQKNRLNCMFCDIENELYENYHVDHNYPSFNTLKNNFLSLTKKQIPTSFDDCPIYNTAIFKSEDEDFKNEWIEYHNNNCNLQILCRNCNLTKSKK
jgi:hypothetical protein